ncbi:hematopoietic prostaglandin D synthase-like [Liolophura sinensis]|uniref:hematopoietic prostaglandin D synthase-like n=1 Tax=Liolophura sinensis TaxID=3198878 RepID=UPI003158DB63
MPQYKLTYFDGRGRAEVTRLLFAVAGVNFQDNRIGVSIPPQPSQLPIWLDMKPNTPFGQLPLLEFDGKLIAQSHAIERYLAREFGLYGEGNYEMALTDMWIDSFEELISPIIQYNFGPGGDTEKAEQKKKYLETTLPTYFKKLETDLGNNSSGYLVGKGLTVGDLYVLKHNEWVMVSFGEEGQMAVKKYPNVQAHIKRISALPKVAAWLEKRPQNKF